MTAGWGWRARAACADVSDPEVFFPVAESGPVLLAQVAAAKAVCARCPVREECLRWALDGLVAGVAGGLTADERRELRAVRGATAGAMSVDACASMPAMPVGATRRELAETGRAALRAGWVPAAVSAEFGVTERSAQRWAAQVRQEQQECRELVGRPVSAGQDGRGAA